MCETSDVERNSGSGQKRDTTIAEERYLKRFCLQNRHASASLLKIELADSSGAPSGTWFACLSPKEKDLAYSKNGKSRLAWTKKHILKT